MADLRISQLPPITGASMADTDQFVIARSSTVENFSVTRAEMFSSVSAISLTGDLTIADKIVHSGDTNTSIRFPAADTVTVETDGVERMRITAAGNVGIKRTNPTSSLDVGGGTLGTTAGDVLDIARFNITTGNGGGSLFSIRAVRVSNGSDWTSEEFRLRYTVDNNTSKQSWIAFVNPSTVVSDNAIRFGEGVSTEWMRIADGRVGIGTNSPSATLTVDGTVGGTVIATQAEAEAGTSSTKLMTPQRTAQAIAALAATTNVQTFSSSGTWTKPANVQFVRVRVWGAGGGGGSGGAAGNTVQVSGGAGGGGGAYAELIFDADLLPSTVAVTIGAGGAGGAARVATTSGSGNAGSAGGNTTFGAQFIASGGSGGAGGPQGGSASGGAGGNPTSSGLDKEAGANGGSYSHLSNNASAGGSSNYAGGGGGAGGGASSTTLYSPAAGGTLLGTNLVAGAAGTSAAAPTAGGNGQNFCGGGGGGSTQTANNGGRGGGGGIAGGGGGGGTVLSGSSARSSGAGGNGGNGYAEIISW